MTVDEAKGLLNQYADGVLETEPARELEGLLAQTPALQKELSQIKEENLMLEQALAPLRPSKSARMRLSDAMIDVHRRAKSMAESVPERGSRIFRLAFSLLALSCATLLAQYRPPVDILFNGGGVMLTITMTMFFVGLAFVLLGGSFARTEARLKAALRQEEVQVSALGVLMLQVFGVLSVLTAFAMYLWLIWNI